MHTFFIIFFYKHWLYSLCKFLLGCCGGGIDGGMYLPNFPRIYLEQEEVEGRRIRLSKKKKYTN